MKQMIVCLAAVFMQILSESAAVEKCTVQEKAHGSLWRTNNEIYEYPKLKKGRMKIFRCEKGYEVITHTGEVVHEMKLTCTGTEWDVPYPSCRLQKTNCKVPAIDYGVLYNEAGDTLFDKDVIDAAVVDYLLVCSDGYTSEDGQYEGRTTCNAGNWSSDFPRCQIVRCMVPVLEHGTFVSEGAPVIEVTYGSTVSVLCEEGYFLFDNKTGNLSDEFSTTCLQTGNLDNDSVFCKERGCSLPTSWFDTYRLALSGSHDTVTIDPEDTSVDGGQTVQAYCRQPHTSVTCSRGDWSSQPAPCRDIDGECNEHQRRCNNGVCIRSILFCDSIVDCADLSDENTCLCKDSQVRCDNGMCIDMTLVCDGVPQCLDESDENNCAACVRSEGLCMDLTQQDGVSIAVGDEADHRVRGQLTCGPAQYPHQISAQCVNGLWLNDQGQETRCTYVECQDAVPVTNVDYEHQPIPGRPFDVQNSQFLYGDTLQVSNCHGNLEFVGNHTISCQEDGTWFGHALCRTYCENGEKRFLDNDNTKVNTDINDFKIENAYTFQECKDACKDETSFLCRTATFLIDAVNQERHCYLYDYDAIEENVSVSVTWWQMGTLYCSDDD